MFADVSCNLNTADSSSTRTSLPASLRHPDLCYETNDVRFDEDFDYVIAEGEGEGEGEADEPEGRSTAKASSMLLPAGVRARRQHSQPSASSCTSRMSSSQASVSGRRSSPSGHSTCSASKVSPP